MAFEKPAVIIDNGSYNIKAGFACDNHPVSIFRTVVGRPSYLKGSYGREPYEVFIGDEASYRIDELELSSPVVNGTIVNWDNMERIWHHVYYKELKVAPEDRAVILAASPIAKMSEKIKCCEVFFETLNAPGLCIQPQSILALYGSGFTTGVSVDLGHDTADVSPGFEGGAMTFALMRTGVAGAQLNEFIKNSLDKRGIDLGIFSFEIIEDIKLECCYVASDPELAPFRGDDYNKVYTLPSGEEITVSEEACAAGELLFNPRKRLGSDALPLQEAVVTAAMKCDAELRPDLYDAIVLHGGLAMLPGVTQRLSAEIEALLKKPVNVIPSTEAYSVAWLGGATFAGLPDATKIWVLKSQYEEYGEKIIKNKFL